MLNYSPTPLEKAISTFYQRLQIHHPEDLEEKAIAQKLRIYFYRKPMRSMSYENGRFQSITVDQRLPLEVQREQFYHELCHLIRHCGWQLGMMPHAFRELQEWDARHFTRYAAIPYHMIQHVNLEDPSCIEQTSIIFKVTPELCIERLLHIKKRMAQHVY